MDAFNFFKWKKVREEILPAIKKEAKETSEKVENLETKVDEMNEKLDKILSDGGCKAMCPTKEKLLKAN